MKTTFTVPFPPSVNSMFATDWKTKRRFPSKQYIEWQAAADAEFYRQRPRPVKGLVSVLIELQDHADGRIRDGDNYVKGLFDRLKYFGIIEDDSRRFVREHTVRWDAGVEGARITVTPWAASHFKENIRPFQQIGAIADQVLAGLEKKEAAE